MQILWHAYGSKCLLALHNVGLLSIWCECNHHVCSLSSNWSCTEVYRNFCIVFVNRNITMKHMCDFNADNIITHRYMNGRHV